MDPDFSLLESVEREALFDLYAAADGDVSSRLGLAATTIGAAGAAYACGVSPQNPYLNRVRGLGAVDRSYDRELADASEFFRSCSVAVFGVDVVPGHGRRNLARLLSAKGFAPASKAVKVVRDDDAPFPRRGHDFRVLDAGTGREAEEFARVWARGLPAPRELVGWLESLPARAGWCCKIAYVGTEPVACAASRIANTSTCWLGFSATVPEHRGRGAQSALLAELLTQAQERGCPLVVTEAASADSADSTSLRNLLRVGFRVAYERELFASPAHEDV